jgi:glutamyl-tRNA synthetase
MTEVLCAANLVDGKEDDIVQLERKGYFRIDKVVEDGLGRRAVLFKVPTGGKELG